MVVVLLSVLASALFAAEAGADVVVDDELVEDELEAGAPEVSVLAVVAAAESVAAGAVAVTVFVVIVAEESLLDALPEPLPQEATKRPIERASTLNFTNFMMFNFSLVTYG